MTSGCSVGACNDYYRQDKPHATAAMEKSKEFDLQSNITTTSSGISEQVLA